ncbi:MAG: hypothetical protein ACTH4J_02125 [Vibrio toranzoniae]|uniref:hypothetical protein n=1 Tax=Vibrio toranzoniae TaxID=1194427 RepID=UPI003F9B443C
MSGIVFSPSNDLFIEKKGAHLTTFLKSIEDWRFCSDEQAAMYYHCSSQVPDGYHRIPGTLTLKKSD